MMSDNYSERSIQEKAAVHLSQCTKKLLFLQRETVYLIPEGGCQDTSVPPFALYILMGGVVQMFTGGIR